MPVAAVFGSARVIEGDEEYTAGREMGRLLGEAGWGVMTGGYLGVMEAASRGAHEVGGHVIGVTVSSWSDPHRVNDWVAEERPAADLITRLSELVAADALIAVGGGVGTLTEVALSWNLRQRGHSLAPLILVGERWERVVAMLATELVLSDDDLAHIHMAADPGAAVRLLPG